MALDIFAGLPIFLALHALLAVELPALLSKCAARPDAPGAYGDREPFLPEKHS